MGLNLNDKGFYNGEVRQFSMEQFIGVFPNSINDDLSSGFVNWYNFVSQQGLTMSSINASGMDGTKRKDDVISIPASLKHNCFPRDLCQPLWECMKECLNIYQNKYNFIDREMTSDGFNVNRAKPSGGYHVWHHEHDPSNSYRVIVWMIIIEAPKEGGETEFLHQSIRVEPKVNQLSIWPAGFTHKHRGNPPLDGQKTYITGWFESFPMSNLPS